MEGDGGKGRREMKESREMEEGEEGDGRVREEKRRGRDPLHPDPS
jgi:hypothetical protein